MTDITIDSNHIFRRIDYLTQKYTIEIINLIILILIKY